VKKFSHNKTTLLTVDIRMTPKAFNKTIGSQHCAEDRPIGESVLPEETGRQKNNDIAKNFGVSKSKSVHSYCFKIWYCQLLVRRKSCHLALFS